MGMCFLSTFPSQKFQGDMCRWYELYLHFLLGFFFEDGLFSAGTWFLKRAGTSSNLWLDSLLLHATPAKHGPPWMWVSMLDMPSYHEIACQSWLLEQNLYRFWTLQYTLDVHSIYIYNIYFNLNIRKPTQPENIDNTISRAFKGGGGCRHWWHSVKASSFGLRWSGPSMPWNWKAQIPKQKSSGYKKNYIVTKYVSINLNINIYI